MKKRLMTAALMLSVMLAACGQGKAQASTAAAATTGSRTRSQQVADSDAASGGRARLEQAERRQ